jgi:Helix-turn-helix domain
MAPDPGDTQLERLYRSGASIRETASACGRSPKTVHRRLTAAGVPMRPPGGAAARQAPRARLTPAQQDAVKDTYPAGGVSLHDLGTAYQVSGDTIGRVLRRAGIPVRPRGRTLAAAPAPASQDVLRLHGEGLPPRDIAARLQRGTPASTARQLRRAGVTPHRRRLLPPPAELAVTYAQAGSLRALSKAIPVGEDRLRAGLEEAGVPAGSLRHVPPGLRPEVARLAAAGTAPAQISAQTGVSLDALKQIGKTSQAGTASSRTA